MTWDWDTHVEDDWTDDSPGVAQLEGDVAVGRRCIECLCEFKRAQPESVPNRHKTLCRVCTRLFVEQRGYNMGPERDANGEAHATRARRRRAARERKENG